MVISSLMFTGMLLSFSSRLVAIDGSATATIQSELCLLNKVPPVTLVSLFWR
jgi:hypothetical protein